MEKMDLQRCEKSTSDSPQGRLGALLRLALLVQLKLGNVRGLQSKFQETLGKSQEPDKARCVLSLVSEQKQKLRENNYNVQTRDQNERHMKIGT